jgi:LuxR family maltose regulon positive regulatory protein
VPDPSTVLLTRLKPPANAAHHVRRARLLDVLDDSTRAPLTLLVAPAGSGKTVLLSSWAAESTVTPAWLSIDDAEHQSGHLWDDIAAALRAHPDVPVPGSRPGGRPDAADDAVAHLLNELEGLDCPPTVLVLDDVHLVEHDAELWRALGRFLQHLPAWLHVVASSRRNLALPIDRLRARGTVRELRFADLRFADDEAAEMLDRLSPDLHDDQVRATVAYADGWAAGLHLAAVATRTSHPRDPEEHPGGDGAQMILDYISREVLADEDPLLAQVLVGTSVVARMNTGLAQALTGRTDARALLDLAEARGLFVSRLGSDGDYEVHAPVRDALATELARSDRDRLTA